MEEAFESIINSYLENNVGLIDNFINEDLSNSLRFNLLELYDRKKLESAGIGNDLNFNKNKLIRSDMIYWLDRKHNNIHENTFFDLMDKFVDYLNRTCYSGITQYEFHYAFYEKGSFYKRHLDQFRENQKRAYSMILYLNEDWKEEDGGKLMIYHDNHSQTISPTNRKCVFFKSSELEHEVLLSNKARMSITGWLKTN
jgi:SM-20-related protein